MLRVEPYEACHEAAVRAFHARLEAAGALLFRMAETAPAANPRTAAPGIVYRHFVVTDEGGEVRGGYFIRTQPFTIRGQVHSVGHYSAPLSEGVADRRYAAVGGMLAAHALSEQPLLFAMGMGGLNRPLPRMLAAMGWLMLETPFYFLVLNGARFLRHIGPLRARPARRLAADVLAFSGLGGGSLKAVQAIRRRGRRRAAGALPIEEFGAWADRAWSDNAAQYSLSAVRTADYLRFLYPRGDPRYYGRAAGGGWIEMLDCEPRDRSYFGDLRVAALVDGVAPPTAIPALIDSGVEAARERGADMVISNQMHRDWTAALRAAGFWHGPSNYLLALSKPLCAMLEPLDDAIPRIHFNRGDGDGRVNLSRQGTPGHAVAGLY